MWLDCSQVMSVPLSTLPWCLLRTAASSEDTKVACSSWLREGGLLVHNKSKAMCGFYACFVGSCFRHVCFLN